MPNKLTKLTKKPSRQKPVPVKIVYDSPNKTLAPDADMKWRAKDALRTLAEADRIRKDKALMKAAKAEAKAQIKDLSSVCK